MGGDRQDHGHQARLKPSFSHGSLSKEKQMLVLYHAGLTQASVKVRITLNEKDLKYQSHYLSIPEQDHLKPEYLAINPDGQVPTLIHDDQIITETTVINEYLDDAFPDPPLRPVAPVERARMRRWGQIVDEHLFPAVATLAWHYGIGPILRSKSSAEVDQALQRLPLSSKRQKWLKAARTGFSQNELDEARTRIVYGIELMELALSRHRYLAGACFSLADINVLSSIQRMPRWAPDLMNDAVSPATFTWLQRMMERPAVRATLSVSAEAPTLEPDALGANGPVPPDGRGPGLHLAATQIRLEQ
jgi:glutathione S-transferase